MNKQIKTLIGLLAAYALSAFVIYAFFSDQLYAMANIPIPDMGVSNFVLGLVNAGIILGFYGLFGLTGYWFARRLGLPNIFSEDGNWRRWSFIPMMLGLGGGVLVILVDVLFAPINGFGRIVHPAFPSSILASISAGIGEEILFRGFFFGLWALILNALFKRILGRTVIFWIANIIAALAFGAGHLGTVLVLTGASSPSELAPALLVEILILNGIIGIIAGERYMKDGLIAAVGVHFWTDVIFHVIWGLF